MPALEKNLSFRIDKHTLDKIKEIAEQQDRSVNFIARKYIIDGINEEYAELQAWKKENRMILDDYKANNHTIDEEIFFKNT